MKGSELNEYHADFLARDRLAEARAATAHHELVRSLRRRRPLRLVVGLGLIRAGRWLAGAARERAAIRDVRRPPPSRPAPA